MKRETWSQYFKNAPPSVQDYLLSSVSGEHEMAAQSSLAFDHDVWDRIMDVVWDTIFAHLSYQEFHEKISSLAGDRRPEEVERAVLFHVILPLADLVIWDVEGRLEELGVPYSDVQGAIRVSLRPVSYGAAVRRIASQAKISVLGEEMIRRLRDAFVSYIKGVRTIEQFKENLLRTQADGGLGMSEDQVKQFCEIMIEFMATTQIVSEQEYADWMTQQQRRAQVEEAAANPAPMTPAQESVARADVDVQALRVIPRTDIASLETAIDQALSLIQIPNLDDYLKRRLQNIISTRLRDVRNAIQTRAMLEREIKVGGMGIPAGDAEKYATIIEQIYGAQRETIVSEEKQKIQEMQVSQQSTIDDRKKRESEEHAKWYEEKVKQYRPEEVLKKIIADPTSVPSSVPALSATPPTVDGVQPPVRLVGLADELARMDLASFRRLAKTPAQAVEKLVQKFETLRNEGFERWTEGIEAWRRSPLQQQYLRFVSDSFAKGKPMAQLVSERRQEDTSLPNDEELGAIINLNSKVQF